MKSQSTATPYVPWTSSKFEPRQSGRTLRIKLATVYESMTPDCRIRLLLNLLSVSRSYLKPAHSTWTNHSSDHETGRLLFRGFTLEQLWDSDFEDMFSLLVWDVYHTEAQRKDLSRKLARYMQDVSPDVHRAIQSLPYVYSEKTELGSMIYFGMYQENHSAFATHTRWACSCVGYYYGWQLGSV